MQDSSERRSSFALLYGYEGFFKIPSPFIKGLTDITDSCLPNEHILVTTDYYKPQFSTFLRGMV